MEEIKIKLIPTKKLFYNDTSNYGIYSCVTDELDKVQMNDWGNFVIKGNSHKLTLDSEYIAKLILECDKQNRVAYVIQSIYEDVPTTNDKQKMYFNAILTETQADEIFKVYPNEDIIQLIRDDKFDVSKVKGIGEKTYNKIKDKIIETIEYKEALDFLSQYNINNNMIIKMVKHFKSARLLIDKIKENPYIITEVHGIGFIKADIIAMNMGYDPNGELRIISAIEHIIKENEISGHTYIDKKALLKNVEELIQVDNELINSQIKTTNNIIVFENQVALKKTYNYEEYVATQILERLNNSTELNIDIEKFIIKMEEKHNIQLTEQQKQFFYNFKKYNINYLIGFAGTGKSQIQKLMIDMLEELNLEYLLLAPTGKARKVLESYVQRKSYTVHKATGLREDGETVIMLSHNVIVVDEASMMDIRLAAKLLSRIEKEDARIIFIGDPFQIPSVSAGNFLHDSIESGILPTTKLDKVFRQKEGGILDIATKVRLGERFINNDLVGVKKFGDNCIVASCSSEDSEDKKRVETMVEGYQYYYNQFLNTYKPEDIFILSPTKKGELGTVTINQMIQNTVNPESSGKKEIKHGMNTIFREGDYVINTKNTYEILDVNNKLTDIVNGDTGKIIKIDNNENELIINFDDKNIVFPFKMLDQLLHSWSITDHKSQGSSSKVVIAIVDKGHKFMLSSNLIYTAFTRAEEHLIILTQGETLNYTMRKVENLRRNTFLQLMLMEGSTNYKVQQRM